MIEVKRVEIRDSMTMIPAIAMKLTVGGDADVDPLLARAGFRGEYVLLIHLEGMRAQYDPFEWGSASRTMTEAHRWLCEAWDRHRDGGVVDVQYILGETAAPKQSEVTP